MKVCRAVGLAGKPTATYADPESELHRKLALMSGELGVYPHSPITLIKKPKPPGGGWIKLVSTEEAKYILRISPKALELGIPTDPWGNPMEVEEKDE